MVPHNIVPLSNFSLGLNGCLFQLLGHIRAPARFLSHIFTLISTSKGFKRGGMRGRRPSRGGASTYSRLLLIDLTSDRFVRKLFKFIISLKFISQVRSIRKQ